MNPLVAIIVPLLLLPAVPAIWAAEPASPPSSTPSDPAAPSFEELVSESGMQYKLPAGFREIDLRPNPLFTYDKAVNNEGGTLEIRYAVRPLGRIEIDYQNPHGSAPDPNHMFPLMFQSMVTLLSDGRHSPTREYPKEQARAKFNADRAAAAVFDISARFNARRKQALVIAMHKNQLADA